MGFSLGIIGSQSKHAEFFGEIFNRQRRFRDFSVKYICPVDEPSRLPYVLGLTDIPCVCDTARQLIDQSDAVLITTRRGETHFAYAHAAMEAGKPVFVDKPFTLSQSDAEQLVRLSSESGVPLVAGSTICFVPDAVELKSSLENSGFALIQYKADPDSEFGGYNFYGSHLTDLCSLWFSGAVSVKTQRNGKNITSAVSYPDKTVILASSPEADRPCVTFSEGKTPRHVLLDDETCYKCGMDAFVAAIGGKKVIEHARLIESVKLLSAINRSLKSGAEEAV